MVDIDISNSDMDLGSMIKDQVAKSIKNVDVFSILQKMADSVPKDEESGEIQSKLQGILHQYNNMPKDDQANFADQIKDMLAKKLATKLKDAQIDFSGVEEALKEAITYQLYLYYFGAAIFIFILISVFFGYKLYKSLKDKEKKREEKKKLKQMKKKK